MLPFPNRSPDSKPKQNEVAGPCSFQELRSLLAQGDETGAALIIGGLKAQCRTAWSWQRLYDLVGDS